MIAFRPWLQSMWRMVSFTAFAALTAIFSTAARASERPREAGAREGVRSHRINARKKLIEYGWDVPSTRSVRQHIREMERIPFDGVVIKVLSSPTARETSESLGWKVFSRTPLEPGTWEHAIADLKATRFNRFTDNFIQVIDMPGVEWFDPEWETVARNAGIMARVARRGGLKGIMFDPEDYGSGIWNYSVLSLKNPVKHSWEETVLQVRERGREFIRSMNAEFPDLTLFCLVGPSLSYGHPDIKTDRYGLLYAFFDGMCEAATPHTTIVDGFEQSYAFTMRKQFQDGIKHILELTKTLSSNPAAFTKHMRAGFGLWMDYDSARMGWSMDRSAMNYFTPAGLQASLAYALESSDRYVWVYSERARWWDFDVPQPYVDALEHAKQGRGAGDPHPLTLLDLPKVDWRFKADEQDGGRRRGWYSPDMDDSAWELAHPGARESEVRPMGMAWYRKRFHAPVLTGDQQARLVVGSPGEVAWVWLNGRLLGGHFFTPDDRLFSIDATGALKPGEDNLLAIRVYGPPPGAEPWQPIRLVVR